MEDSEEYDLGTGLTVITIVLDNTEVAPKIDLDNCPPHIAIQVFTKAIEALESTIPYPTITYAGRTIVSDMYAMEEDEDWD